MTKKKPIAGYFKAWRKIRYDPEISPFDFLLLKEIEDCQGKNTHTWISQSALAQRLNKSRQHVNQRIAFLKKKGLLRILKKKYKRTLKLAIKCQLQLTTYVNPTLQDPVNPTLHNRYLRTSTKYRQQAKNPSSKRKLPEATFQRLAQAELRERIKRGYKVTNRKIILEKIVVDYQKLFPDVEECYQLSKLRVLEGAAYWRFSALDDKLKLKNQNRIKRIRIFLKGESRKGRRRIK